jgi:DNA invertase Pin-like site-specific DNA recombinase
VIGASKVTGGHLRRDAYVYVRQSTVMQVLEHRESLQRQYELAERAVEFGWPASRVVVIDEDLGRSGAEASARTGFQRLVADVGLGQVGLILGIEVSRLARNNADWYQLLDLCALTDTLIADGDGLYHAGDFNDRLVLGLKGTMSEAELHLIRGRLTAGLRHKAARGELRQGLPVGYDYDEADAVVMSADEAVVEAIATVFRRFDEVGSARQVLLGLLEDGLALPRRSSTRARIRWAKATYPAVHDFLTNPCYAGAFVFGRTATDKRVDADGRLLVRTRQVARDQWEVCIPDHHPGFVTWERYEQIQDQLRVNYRPPRGAGGGGAAREGAALLQGRIRCGRCGRMMRTGYSGTKGNCPRYVCAQARTLYGTATACQSLGGRRLEQRVCDEVFAVLEPAALAATAKALAEAETHHAARLKAFELAAERARYDAGRAQRQFDAVEPEHRGDPVPPTPADRHRPGLHQGPREDSAGLARHPRLRRSRPRSTMRPRSPSRAPQSSSTSITAPSTGGCAPAFSSASSSPPARRGASPSTRRSATASSPTRPKAGCRSKRPPPRST